MTRSDPTRPNLTRPGSTQSIRPYPREEHGDPDDFNDLGLHADLSMLARPVVDRRRVLAMGLAGIGLLVACGSSTSSTPSSGSSSSSSGSGSTTSADCPSAIPAETAGPYPADGSVASGQSYNVLTRSGIVRSDLRTSIQTGTTAPGVPVTLTLKLVNVNASCAAIAGYAVYVWHCTRDGTYSLYSSGATSEDYLRGVQVTDSTGSVTFTTIFPGCYAGRWPHVHFEVYPSLAKATSASNKIQTSQLALPEATCRAVYATSGYSSSLGNLNSISLAQDNVFSDGYSTQMATLTGSPSAGYTATLTVGLAL